MRSTLPARLPACKGSSSSQPSIHYLKLSWLLDYIALLQFYLFLAESRYSDAKAALPCAYYTLELSLSQNSSDVFRDTVCMACLCDAYIYAGRAASSSLYSSALFRTLNRIFMFYSPKGIRG